LITYLKILGLLLILVSSTILGYYKGYILRRRAEKLKVICLSLEKFSQLVKSGAGELSPLLSMSFSKNILTFSDSSPVINENFLEKEDIKLFGDFLSKAGLSDCESEVKRIAVYKTIFESNCQKAKRKSDELCKLYNSLGFLIGIFICILLV